MIKTSRQVVIFICRQWTNILIRLKLLIGCTNRTDWQTYWHIALDSELPFHTSLGSIKYWLSYLQPTGGRPYNWKCEMKCFCFQLCALALRAELIEGKTNWIHFRYIRSENGSILFCLQLTQHMRQVCGLPPVGCN